MSKIDPTQLFASKYASYLKGKNINIFKNKTRLYFCINVKNNYLYY